MGSSRCSRAVAVALVVATGAVVGGCGAGEDPRSLKRERALSESESGPTADGEGPEGAFDYAPDLSLLPFDVRLAKVASVAGIETDDSALATMRARRFDLGDHDHAKGVKADLTWSASRIGTWVKALRPVCASTAMRRSYPALPQNLGELVLAAYGRAATDEDRAAVKEAVAASALDSESEYQVICLAILSSLEFVAR